jgi:hypothetical protein
VADWATIAQVATAAGTLVLAAATFSSIRASQRAARVAERSLLAGQRPLLIPSREDDPQERIRFGDGQIVTVDGHGGRLQRGDEGRDERLYLAIALRNGGAGIAVIHGWSVTDQESPRDAHPPEPDRFRRQLRDLYVPAGDTGFWQGAIRDREDPDYQRLAAAEAAGERVMVDLLYGDHEGGQRTITRFGVSPTATDARAEVLRVWVLDGVDPRQG